MQSPPPFKIQLELIMYVFLYGGLVMKAKFLLGAIIALLVSQPMQALRIIFVNKGYQGPVEALCAVKYLRPVRNMPGGIVRKDIGFQQPIAYSNIEKLVMLGVKYNNMYTWGFDDLSGLNIPLSGDHTITVYVENATGLFGIKVDNGDKMIIQGMPSQTMPEDV